MAVGRSFGSLPSFMRIDDGRGWKFGAFPPVLELPWTEAAARAAAC